MTQKNKIANRDRRGGGHREEAPFAGAQKASRGRHRRRLELDLREQRKVLSGKLQSRHADGELGRPPGPARPRHHLDRHAALHAFRRYRFRARSRQTRFLSGAHGHGPRRSGRNVGRVETFSRVGHDALSAALRNARRFADQKTARGKFYRQAARHPDAKFQRPIFESRSAGALAAEDRDQRTERAHSRNLCGSDAALARRYRRRLCARKNPEPPTGAVITSSFPTC